MEAWQACGTLSYTFATAGPSTSCAGTGDAFEQCMSGLQSLAQSIAGPRFVPPQQHQVQGLSSPSTDSTAVAAFMAQQRQQLLQVDQATAEGKHALAVQLLTQVSIATVCMSVSAATALASASLLSQVNFA